MKTLNERIKNLRKGKGWTQLQLAEKLNVTDKAVSKWEVGEANPDLTSIVNIASLFGVTMDYLLTGKIEGEKVVAMSNLELCCKNDDVTIFEKLVTYVDDTGTDILVYIEKYEARKVLRAYVEKQPSIRLSGRDQLDISSAKKLELISKYSLCESLYNRMGISSYSANDNNTCQIKFPSMYHNAMIPFVIGTWPEKTILNKFLSLHVNADARINYIDPYSTLIKKVIGTKNVELIKYIFDKIIDFNNEQKTKYDSWGGNKAISYNFCYDSSTRYFYAISFTTKQIISMCELGLVDEGRIANKYIYDGNHTKPIEENQFKKYDILKEHPGTDTRFLDVSIGNIVIVDRVLATKDSKFIVETIKNNPIYNSEYLYRLVNNEDYKKIYEFAIDNNLDSLAQSCITGDVKKESFFVISNMIYELFIKTSGNHYVSYRERNGIVDLATQDANNGYLFVMTDKYGRKYKLETRKIDKLNDYRDDSSIKSGFEELDKKFSCLDEYKKSIISEYEAKIQMIEMISSTFTKEFFMAEVAQQHFENCIIKLCTLFEMKLKANGQSGDFSIMLDGYCSRFYGDDGWGYTECKDSYKVDIINRLRIQRNNILHADAKDVKPLTAKELVDCINEICDWEVR